MRKAIGYVNIEPNSIILDVGGANTYYNQDRSYKHMFSKIVDYCHYISVKKYFYT